MADAAPTQASEPRRGGPPETTEADLLKIIIAVLLPPVAVYLQRGMGGAFFLNILLTLLGFLPGQVHAVYVIIQD